MILSGQVSSPAGGGTTEITIPGDPDKYGTIYYTINGSYSNADFGNDKEKTIEVDSGSIFVLYVSSISFGGGIEVSQATEKYTYQLSESTGKLMKYIGIYLAN